ncbi:glycosyltransferase [Patescibacteria group bacterium]|nr:glycosyltransferase [Patescibacteria group bacterium]MBU4078509.1 glycosyltransferase [Patescibacteria group bacterium]
MKKIPKVSVVIPTYKRSHLIGRAVRSVLNQTYQDFEIVVVDDNPDNETEKVVDNFNDIRIKYIHNKVGTKLKTINYISKARNQGVRESNQDSKYIAFLDDDDEWFPRFLEKTTKRLEEKNELAFVTTYAELRTQSGEKLPKIHGKLSDWWNVGAGNGCVLRKEIFDKQNIWFDQTTIFDDQDFGFRILKNFNNKAESIPEVLYVFYCYPAVKGESASTSLTSEGIEDFYKKNYQIYQKIGRKASGWLCFFTGNLFCRAGKIQEGRNYLLKACLTYPHPRYLLHYLISLFFPSSFQNIRLKILKQKIFRGKI